MNLEAFRTVIPPYPYPTGALHQQHVVGRSGLQMTSGVHTSTSLSLFSIDSTASEPGFAFPRTSSQTCLAGLSNVHIVLV